MKRGSLTVCSTRGFFSAAIYPSKWPRKENLTGDDSSGCKPPNPSGLLLSIVALSFGAPFWFEVLKSAINMKSSFTPDAKKK